MELSEMIRIVPAAIIGLTVHEFAHAFAAYKLGDDTAKNDGRITLNPLKHIDWLGLLLIIMAGFGWAKPVMFNPDNLKKKHRDEILISIAGPISNFLLAILFMGAARILYSIDAFSTSSWGFQTIQLLIIWGVINLGLFLFNLIPIPPLDGSHLYLTYLKDINPRLMSNMYKYGTFVLLGIILLENNTDINILHLSDASQYITSLIINTLNFN